jgi:plastocyanin
MTFQVTKMVAVYALAAMMVVAVTASSNAGAQEFQQPAQTQPNATSQSSVAAYTNGSQLDGQLIYETGSITADSDVKTLVITIPDNAGADSSAWEGFLPSNATVAVGTNVVVLNADVNATHTITMSGGENQSAAQAVPYQNSTAFLLNETGEYTFTDQTTQINATVNVAENASTTDDPITNEFKSAVGLFLAPSSAKSSFEGHLNNLGFNAVSTYNFSGSENASAAETTTTNASDNATTSTGNITASSDEMTLFVWTQQVSHPNTIDGRLTSKVRILEEVLYPGDAIKQNNTSPAN